MVDVSPAGLSVRSSDLWRAVVDEYELGPAELELLLEACRCLDRADEARDLVDVEGIVAPDRFGSPRTHPGIDVEHRNRVLYARLVAQLGLKLEADVSTRRPGTAKPGPKPRAAVIRQVT